MAEEFYVKSGEGANLSTVRATRGDSFSIAIQQLMVENETILFGPSEVKLSLIRSSEEHLEELSALGTLLITTESVLFWAADVTFLGCDLAVPAVCIDLHAMAEDPVSVYIQVRPSSMSFDDTSIEVTILSAEKDRNELIFAALCKLVALHPVDDGEEENPGFGQDEMIVRSGTPPVTEEDRESMLVYLDSVLVVPQELEIQESQVASGQFDDADDDDDDGIL